MAPPHHAREGGQRAMAAEGPRSFYGNYAEVASSSCGSIGAGVANAVRAA